MHIDKRSSLMVVILLPHYQSLKSARGAAWQIMTIDPQSFWDGTPLFAESKTSSLYGTATAMLMPKLNPIGPLVTS